METVETKKSGTGYHYLILTSCCCMSLVVALMMNCIGVFSPVVSAHFGVATVQFMLYFTIMNIIMMVWLPFAGRLIAKIDLRIMFTICGILCTIANLIFAFSQSIEFFYVGSVFAAFGFAPIVFLYIPRVISSWFADRVGFFTGFAFAFTGIGGVIFNPIMSSIIASGDEGWRTAYIVSALLICLFTVPLSLFVLRNKPEDKGLKPYGFKETTDNAVDNASVMNTGVPYNKALKTSALYAIIGFALLLAFNQMMYQFFPKYCLSFTDSMPDIAALSATIASFCMAGLVIGKIALGAINDRSPKMGIVTCIACGILGMLCIWLMPSLAPVLLAGAFLFGWVYAATTVVTPLLVREVFGNREYASIYAVVGSFITLGGAVASTVLGIIADMPNGFNMMWILSIVLMAISLLLGFFALSKRNAYERTTE